MLSAALSLEKSLGSHSRSGSSSHGPHHHARHAAAVHALRSHSRAPSVTSLHEDACEVQPARSEEEGGRSDSSRSPPLAQRRVSEDGAFHRVKEWVARRPTLSAFEVADDGFDLAFEGGLELEGVEDRLYDGDEAACGSVRCVSEPLDAPKRLVDAVVESPDAGGVFVPPHELAEYAERRNEHGSLLVGSCVMNRFRDSVRLRSAVMRQTGFLEDDTSYSPAVRHSSFTPASKPGVDMRRARSTLDDIPAMSTPTARTMSTPMSDVR